MATKQFQSFQECIELVEDPRVGGRCVHPLDSLLFLTVAAVISGADGPADIESFGIEKQEWLARFVDFPAGIPSHDTIGRVLSMIDPSQFQKALLQWTNELRSRHGASGPIVLSIDGKTVRGSHTDGKKSNAIHIVSAWATDQGLSLGQVAVDSKSNEITAIPELLKLLDLNGTIVTLDAMGCQKSIAKQIFDSKGDYTFSVKDNHLKLAAAIRDAFSAAYEEGLVAAGFRSKTTKSKGHGRLEERHYCVASIPEELKELASAWAGAKSIGQAITTTTVGEKVTQEVRYYISSRPAVVGEFANSVRKHWGGESTHWILDVVFREDASRIRTGNAAANMSFTRRFVTTLLKQDTSRTSLKAKRKRAGWNTDFLEKLLFGW